MDNDRIKKLAEQAEAGYSPEELLARIRFYELRCFICHKAPSELDEYIEAGAEVGMTPEEFVVAEEGTYNPMNGHFCCTRCYLDLGMPTSPGGWRAP